MSNEPLILFIDGDHHEHAHYTQLLRITSQGFVVLHVTTGEAGLALCERRPIDCVVLELDLPDMSGFEVLLKLIPRVDYPEIAVVILTRFENPHLLQAAIKNGAQAALYKGRASGDILNRAILNAISTVQTNRQRLVV
jgi:DNA-binding NarL/FixJ family response regulator